MALIQQFFDNVLLYTFVLVFIISLVVFVHEMGHYLTARLFGVKIRKFSIGFGRELFGLTDKKGTRWALSLIPLGGYVELFGYSSSDKPKIWDQEKKELREFTEEEQKVAFCFKPLWQRSLIVAMGPMVNFLLTFFIIASMFLIIGERSTTPVIYAVAKGTPAYEAGLQPLDEILKFNGEDLVRLEDIWEHSRIPNTSMIWTIKRGDETFDVSLTSVPIEYNDNKGIVRAHGRVGATNFPGVLLEDIMAVNGLQTNGNEEKNRALLLDSLDVLTTVDLKFADDQTDPYLIFPISKMNEGLTDPESIKYKSLILTHEEDEFFVRHNILQAFWYAGAQIYEFIEEAILFFDVVLFGEPPEDSDKIGGLVTMGKITGEAFDAGWYIFFMVIAVFSLQIAIINLLPIPALDGGYLIFFAYEAIAGKPLSEKVQDYALSIGVLLLIGLMLVANISDILGLLSFS